MQVSSSGLERAGDDLFPAKAEIEPRFPSLGELETAKGESARFLLGSLLRKVLKEGLITPEEAYMKATDKDAFQHLLPK